MKRALCFVLPLVAMSVVGVVRAQDYPSRPIRIVTGFGPGGIGFAVPRMFAEEMSRILNQRIVIDDRPGAGNSIGAKLGARAQPDGYTFFIGGLAPHPVLQKNGIDLTTDMQAVAMVLEVPLVFATSTKLPLKSVEELVAFAKVNPGKLNFASSGGSPYLSLMMRLLAERAGGFAYADVPYRNASDIQIGFARGDVHIALTSTLSVQAPMKRGDVTPILLAGASRSALLPDVPTPAESGVRNFSVETLFGLWAPQGTPRALIARINAAANQTATNPEYIARVRKAFGVEPAPGTPEQALARFKAQLDLIREAVRISNFAPE